MALGRNREGTVIFEKNFPGSAALTLWRWIFHLQILNEIHPHLPGMGESTAHSCLKGEEKDGGKLSRLLGMTQLSLPRDLMMDPEYLCVISSKQT